MANLENNWLKLIGQPQAEAVSSITSIAGSTRIKGVHEEEEKRAATNYPKRPSRCRSYTVFTASSHVDQLRSAGRCRLEAPAPEQAPDDADDDAGGAGAWAGAGAGADDPSRMSSKRINCGLRASLQPHWGPKAGSPSVCDIRWLHDDDDDDDLHGETSTGNLTNLCELASAELAAPQHQAWPQRRLQHQPQPAAQAEPALASEASGGRDGRICANKNKKKIQLNYYPQDSRMAALNNQAAALASVASSDWALLAAGLQHTKWFKVRKGTMRPVTGAAGLGLSLSLYLVLMLAGVVALLTLAGPSEGSLVVDPHQHRAPVAGQLSGAAKPASARLIRSAGQQEAGEHDLLLELLQSTGSLNEANRLIETLIGSKLDNSKPVSEPDPPKPDYELIRASGLATDQPIATPPPMSNSSRTTPPPDASGAPIRVYLPQPLAESHIELTGNAGQVHLDSQQHHPKHRGLLDEIIEASATARPLNRSSEPNAKVHYDEASAAAEHQQHPKPAGLLLDAARASGLLRASKQIENILSPPPVVERQVLATSGNASTLKPATAHGQPLASADEEGLSNNESISSLIIGSAAPTRQLIANYSHWIVHERLPTGGPSSRPEAIRFVQAPTLMTTSQPPVAIIHQQLPPLDPPAPPVAQLPEAGRARQISSAPPQPTPTTSSPAAPDSASLTAGNGFSHEQFLSLGSGQQATHVQQQQLRQSQLQQVSELMQPAPEQQRLQLANREQAQPGLAGRQVVQVGNGLHEGNPTPLTSHSQPQLQVASSAGHKSAEVLEVSVFADTLEAPPAIETPAKRGASLANDSASALSEPYIILRTPVSWSTTAGPPVGALPPARRLTTKLWSDLNGLTVTTRRPQAALNARKQQVNNEPLRKELLRKNGSKRRTNTSGARKKKKKPKKQVVVTSLTSVDQVLPDQMSRPKAAPGVAHLLLGTSSASDRLPSGSHPLISSNGTVLPINKDGSGSQIEPATTSNSPVLFGIRDSFNSDLDPINRGTSAASRDSILEASSSVTSRDNNITEMPLESKGSTRQSPISLFHTTSDLELTELTRAQRPAKRELAAPVQQPLMRSLLSTSSRFEQANLNGHDTPTSSTRDMAWWERRPTPTTPAPLTSRLIDQLAGHLNASAQAAAALMPNEPLIGARSQVDAAGTTPILASSSGLFGKRLVEEASSPTRVAGATTSAGKRRPPATGVPSMVVSLQAAEADPAGNRPMADAAPDEGRSLAARQHEGLLNSFSTEPPLSDQPKPKMNASAKRLPELTMVHLGASPMLVEPTASPLEPQRLGPQASARRPQGAELKVWKDAEVSVPASELFQYKSANRWPTRVPLASSPQPKLNPILEPEHPSTALDYAEAGPTSSPATTAQQHQLSQPQPQPQHPLSLPPSLVDVRPTTTGSPAPPVPVGSRAAGSSSNERAKSSQARFNRLRGQRGSGEGRQPHQGQHQPMNATEQTKAPLTTNARANNSNRWLLRRGDKQRLVPRHGITASSPGSDSSAAISSSVQVASPSSLTTATASNSTLAPDTPLAGLLDIAAGRLDSTHDAPTVRVDQVDVNSASLALDAARRPLSEQPPSALGVSSNKAPKDTEKQGVFPQQQRQNVDRGSRRFRASTRKANSIVSVDELESSLPSRQKVALKLESSIDRELRSSGSAVATTASSITPTTTSVLADRSFTSKEPSRTTIGTNTVATVVDRLAQQSQLELQFQWPPVGSSSSEGLRRWRQADRKRRPSSSTSSSSIGSSPTSSTTTSTTSLPIEFVQVSSEEPAPRLGKSRASLANLFKRLPAGADTSQQVAVDGPVEDNSQLTETSSSGLGDGQGPVQAAQRDTSQPRAQGEPRAGQREQHLQVAAIPASGLLADELRASALVKTMINLGAPGGTFQSSSSASRPASASTMAVMSEQAGERATTGQPPAEPLPAAPAASSEGSAEPVPRRIRGDLHKSGQMERRHERRKFIAVAASGPEFPSVDSRASLDQQAVVWDSAISSSPSSSSASSSPGLGQPLAKHHPPLPQPAVSKAAAEADWRLQMRASRPRHHQSQAQPQPQLRLQQQAEAPASWHHPRDVSPWTQGAAGWPSGSSVAAPSGQRYAHDTASTPTGAGGGWILNGSHAHQDTDQASSSPTNRQLQLQFQQQQQQAGAGITWLYSGTTEAPPTLLVYDELLGSEQSAAPARTTQASQPAQNPSIDQLLLATESPDYRPPILGPHHHYHHQSSSTPHPGSSMNQQQLAFSLNSRLPNQLRGTRQTGNASATEGSPPLLELARRTQLSRSQEIAILIIVFSCGALVLALVAMALSIKCRIAFNKATSNDAAAGSHVPPAPQMVSKSLSETKIIKRAVRRSNKVSGARRALKEAESKLLLAQKRAGKHHAEASSDSGGSPGADHSSCSEAGINLVASKDLETVLATGARTGTKLMLLSPTGASKMPLASRLKRSLKRQKRGKRQLGETHSRRQDRLLPEHGSLSRGNMATGGTLRQRISGTITSRLLKMQLPRLLPYFALDYSNNPQQQQQHHLTNKHGQFAFDVHQPTNSDLQTSNGKKLASPLTVGDLMAGSGVSQRHMNQERSTRPLPNMEQENFHLKSPAKHMPLNNSRLMGHKNRAEGCDKQAGREFIKRRPTTKLTGCQCVSCAKAKQELNQDHTSNLPQEETPPAGPQQHQPIRKPKLLFGAASSVLRQPKETVPGSTYGEQQLHPEADANFQNRRHRAFCEHAYCETGHCSQVPQMVDVVDNQRNIRKLTGAINSGEQSKHNQEPSMGVSSNESSINLHDRDAAVAFHHFARQVPEKSQNELTGISNRYQDDETDNYYHLNNAEYLAGVASSDYQDGFGDSLAREQINQQQLTRDNQLVEAIVCSNNYLCPNGQPQTHSSRLHNQMSDCNCKMVMHPI